MNRVSPKLSVIIPAFNGEAYLGACLQSVLAQAEADVEVIVVDNASTDRSAEVVASYGPPVRLIPSALNRGFSGGCNLGLRAAQGELLVLLNQDTQVAPGWLAALRAGFAAQADAGILGCKILYPETHRLQHAGGWIEWPLAWAHHFGYGDEDHGQWDQPRTVEYVTGAALALRRTVLDQIGFLDEDFWPGYFEDVDYCRRASVAGLAIWYWPTAMVWHHESPSTNAAGRSRYYQRGRLRCVLKHLPPARFLTEFVPAELAAQTAAIAGEESQAIRLAYLAVIPDVAKLWRRSWQSDKDTIKAGIAALQQLYLQAGELDWQRLSRQEAATLAPLSSAAMSDIMLSGKADLLPEYVQAVQARQPGAPPAEAAWLELKEYSFRSSIPVVGQWLARWRTWWYGLAARWAMLYFMQQQEAINRRQESYRRAMGRRLLDLAEQNAQLAARLAELGPLANDGDERV